MPIPKNSAGGAKVQHGKVQSVLKEVSLTANDWVGREWEKDKPAAPQDWPILTNLSELFYFLALGFEWGSDRQQTFDTKFCVSK